MIWTSFRIPQRTVQFSSKLPISLDVGSICIVHNSTFLTLLLLPNFAYIAIEEDSMFKTAIAIAGAAQIHSAADLARGGTLLKGQVASLRGRPGMKLICGSGQLWVTVEGDPADHVLSAGQGLTLERPGLVVLGGGRDATYLVA